MNESHKNTATYIKLQDAYVSERNQAGDWKQVGYVAPGATKSGEDGTTTNFKYTQGEVATSLTSGATSVGVGWSADNRVALNDCAAGAQSTADAAHWKVELFNTSNGNSIVYDAQISEDAANPGACEQLTPSYKLISSKKATN